jgi:hypothetical protein
MGIENLKLFFKNIVGIKKPLILYNFKIRGPEKTYHFG